MAAEIKVVQHVDDVVQAVLVPPPQVVQDADLYQSLVMKSFLIPEYDQRNEKQKKKKIQFCVYSSPLSICRHVQQQCAYKTVPENIETDRRSIVDPDTCIE